VFFVSNSACEMPNFLNIAHRGGAQLWPENTLPAFIAAARAGFHAAELDVQLTRDDRLVVFHDFRLKPGLCRNVHGEWLRPRRFRRLSAIRDLSFDELRRYDVGRAKPGSLYARRHSRVAPFDGARMPSLSEVIAAVRRENPDFRLFIEIKTARRGRISAPPEAVADAVLDDVQSAGFLENVVLVGFDWAGLTHAKKRNADVQCWFTTDARSRAGAHQVATAGGDGWFPPLHRATDRAIETARAYGLLVGVWTVNRAKDMQRLIERGVDGICTDRPDRLQRLLTNLQTTPSTDNVRQRTV
jgi:glycerophosphoryl diester phosphodiesterase